MSARDRITSVNVAPGSIVKTAYFNLATASSMEYNIDDENQRRSEHSIVDFVITIPTFYDDEFEAGYTAADALEVSRNSGDTTKIDINAGAAYIGGRRYKQINDNVAYDLVGSTDNLYYIRLKYTLSTNTFAFIAETSEAADSETVKYLSLASATWDTTPGEWVDDFSDLRATNTSLPPPITFAGTSSSSILTLQQDGTGPGLKVVGNATGGDVTFFDTTNARKVSIYGDGTDALTIHNAALYSVTLTADNSNRLLVSNDIKATAGYFGSAPIILSGTTIKDFQTLEFKTSATVSGSGVTSIAFSSMDFTGVGDIGAASLDSVGNVQGDVLISDITTGTAPLTITSTTLVSNLNVDQVDGYDFTGASGSVSASAAELNNLDGYTGDLADLNKIIESARSQGEVLYASAAATLAWLSSSDGYLNNASGVITWDSSPEFTGATVQGATGMTWDNTTTDVVVTSTDGELYFGDGTLIADKETSPDWSITGAGAGSFASVGAPTITASTTLSVTSGPSMTSAGIATAKALSGVTTISGTGAWGTTSTIDFSGILSGATKAEINAAADATGRAAGDLRYASAINTLAWLGIGGAGQYLIVSGGVPAWATLPTYDNYASWTYKLDGFDQDAVGSAQTLEFVSGDDISITDTGTRVMTFNVVTTSTATDADASPISSNWAYDHASGETVNLHTKVGSITSGTWGGTAVAANKGGTGQTSYTIGDIIYASGTSTITKLGIGAAGTVLIGGATPSWNSTPSVSTITTTGSGSNIAGSATVGGVVINSSAISSVTTIVTSSYADVDYLRLSDDAVATSNKITLGNNNNLGTTFEIMAEGGGYLQVTPSTSARCYFGENGTGYGFGANVYASGFTCANGTDIIPENPNNSDCGTQANHWDYVWANYIKYDESSTSFDHLDDLALIETIKPSEKTDPVTGLKLADLTGLPVEVHDSKSGFTDMGNMHTLLAGGIKQLYQRFKEQDEVVGMLMDRIEDLEKTIESFKDAS